MLVPLIVIAALTPYTLLVVLAFQVVKRENREAEEWVKSGIRTQVDAAPVPAEAMVADLDSLVYSDDKAA
ncbi:MAG: hypothetical protein OQK12_19190 [Motiliproteus sp.]|nr:hypothetical protein [Motiliproteus sp.]